MKSRGGLHPARPDWWPRTKRPRFNPFCQAYAVLVLDGSNQVQREG